MNIFIIGFLLITLLNHQFNVCEANDFWDDSVRSTRGTEFLFVASISLRNHGYDPAVPVHVCSGVLITRRHVITSAHCMTAVHDFQDVLVKVGYKDLAYTAKYNIKAWTTYDLWAKDNGITTESLEHDIAIIKIIEKAELVFDTAKITKNSNDFFDGKKVETVVWGPHTMYRGSMLLKVAELNVISYNDCMKELNESQLMLKNHTIDKQYVCTKINLGAVLEEIDSGGPLLINGNELIAINDPTYLKRRGIHAPTNLNFHLGLDYYRTFIKNVTKSKGATWWQWRRS